MSIEKGLNNRSVTVRTFKYDGTPHRHWRAQLVKQEEQLLVLDAKFEKEIEHSLLGTIHRGTVSVEYYWLDRWYNIFRFLGPDGELRNFYCNINVPPNFCRDTLSYIDLDMDVLVEEDMSFSVLDEDEFAANALKFNYPGEIQQRAYQALEELIRMIKLKSYPFNCLR